MELMIIIALFGIGSLAWVLYSQNQQKKMNHPK
jgi:hypothetical protein